MKLEEAEEIINRAIEFEDVSCSCHINPPCGKCTGMPSEEQLEEAERILDKHWSE